MSSCPEAVKLSWDPVFVPNDSEQLWNVFTLGLPRQAQLEMSHLQSDKVKVLTRECYLLKKKMYRKSWQLNALLSKWDASVCCLELGAQLLNKTWTEEEYQYLLSSGVHPQSTGRKAQISLCGISFLQRPFHWRLEMYFSRRGWHQLFHSQAQ